MANFILRSIVLTAALLISITAKAGCYTNQGGAAPRNATITQTPITVQRDAPVGSIIGTITLQIESLPYLSCSGSSTMNYQMNLFSAPTGMPNVFATNITGVGISLMQPSSGIFFKNPASVIPVNGTSTINTSTLTTNLVKTGPITSGVIASGLLAKVSGDDGLNAWNISLSGAAVTQLACSINTPSLTFPIGDIPVSRFGTSVGITPSGAENRQDLGLNCDAGANINVSLSGTPNPDVSTPGVLALSGQGSEGVATGVGVQILLNGAPLNLNDRLLLKQASGGQQTFPLIARYYQTRTTVTTGTANSSATLSITYQ